MKELFDASEDLRAAAAGLEDHFRVIQRKIW
jgi:hypothetical protein